ncbi:MAG: hypothetical protein E6G69_10520 [Alphaproteobacteria bacterium]|nr:MAG: hypothetical protein E6G69_10520 [Alphaproteobacteria bacterium]
MSVFPSADYDPVFVIEANFDGPPGVFWGQMEATLGPQLRAMLRCCKKPANRDGPLFVAVTSPDSRYPVAPYFAARSLRPSAFHHGNRGLDRGRILDEGRLFLATRKALAQPDPAAPNPYRLMPAARIHTELRAALKSAFPWLEQPASVRISLAERIGDWLRVAGFLFLVLVGLSIPGMIVAFISPWPRFLVLFGIAAVLIYLGLYRMRAPLAGKGAPTRSGGLTIESLSFQNDLTSLAHPVTLTIGVLLFLGIYGVVASVIATWLGIAVTGYWFDKLWWPSFRVVALGLLSGVFFTLPAIVLWLRWLELRDSSQDAPPLNPELLREMARREDRIAQNHMGSLVLVKPGVLRMALFRAGHLGLGLIVRATATEERHAQNVRLDFIEKAHGGLTLAWGSGIGFPPTRFLVLDGASHGRQFKAWARHSMTVTRFWFSAYKDYTVDQIERHARIADGLRKPTLTPKEAAEWARDL